MSKKDILNKLKKKHPQININQLSQIYEKFIELISKALLDKKRIEIRKFNEYIRKDKRIKTEIVSIGDGLAICKKILKS